MVGIIWHIVVTQKILAECSEFDYLCETVESFEWLLEYI